MKSKKNFIKVDKNIYNFDNAQPYLIKQDGVYDVVYMAGTVVLQEREKFEPAKKIYGPDTKDIDYIVKSYNQQPKNLGVLLTGLKGLGKTLFAKELATRLNIPVFILKDNQDVFSFLNSLDFPHVIYIDEFDKIFDTYKMDIEDGKSSSGLTQEDLLSFLDGSTTVQNKRVFIVTTNSQVNQYFINRPSRFKFKKDYSTMTIDVVKEILDDSELTPEQRQDILDNITMSNLNYDIILSIIDECVKTKVLFSTIKHIFNFVAGLKELDIFRAMDGKLKYIITCQGIDFGDSARVNFEFEDQTISLEVDKTTFEVTRVQDNVYNSKCKYTNSSFVVVPKKLII